MMSPYFCKCLYSKIHLENEKKKDHMELERKEGQELLRAMASGQKDPVNWECIIRKAEELHHKEQTWLREQDPRERRRFLQAQRRALQVRRKYDSIGSFSINLLSYRSEQSQSISSKEVKSETASNGSSISQDNEDMSSAVSHGGGSPQLPVDVHPVVPCYALSSKSGDGSTPGCIVCPSSSSSAMYIIEDQLHSRDSDSI
jgi:hypothetical protein